MNSVKPSSIDHIGEKAVGVPLKETAAPQQSPQQVRGKPPRKSKLGDECKAVKTLPESTEIPPEQQNKRCPVHIVSLKTISQSCLVMA